MRKIGQAGALRAPSRLMASVLALGLLSGFGFLALCGYILWDGRQDKREQAIASAENLLRAIEQDIARTLELFDVSMLGTRESISAEGLDALSPKLRSLVIFDRTADASYFNATFVTDADGNILYDSKQPIARPGNLGDRDYFRVHRDNPNVGLYVSAPFHARFGIRDWIIALSRRIDRPDGSFGGVVAGSISVDFFTYVFQQLDLGPDSRISLYHANGEMIMSKPFQFSAIGKVQTGLPDILRDPNRMSGQYLETDPRDQTLRTVSFRRIRNLPLVASIALSIPVIDIGWRNKALPLALMMVAILAVILLLALLLTRELRSRKRAELAARDSEMRYRLLSENSIDAIILRGLDRKRRYASPAFYQLIGYTPEAFGDRRLGELLDEASKHIPNESFARIARGEEFTTNLMHVQRGDGAWIWIEAISSPARNERGEIDGVISNLRDVTRRKLAEDQLASSAAKLAVAALKDSLTGLDNRRSFDERIERVWRATARSGAPLSLLMLDVDHFKMFNDRYGHVQGDEALRRVADCICANLRRGNDFGARYGGEEFTVLLPETGRLGAYHVAETIRTALQEAAIPNEGSPFGCLTVSIGVASIDAGDRSDCGALVLAADAALYRAKLNGRNTTERAHPDLTASAA
jgi:diguanylate cyclase (GGDEF)-like protein/PAS domain S-box-containing protein